MPSKKNVGRPPTGIQDRVRLSTFLTPWGRALLEALSHEEERPAYELVEEGILSRFQDLDPERRQRVEKVAKVLERRTRRETLRRRQKDWASLDDETDPMDAPTVPPDRPTCLKR